MPSHYSNYADYPTQQAADAAAIRDVFNYLSPGQRETISREYFRAITDTDPRAIRISNARDWIKSLAVAMHFAGISGYPVKAMQRAWLTHAIHKRGPHWLITGDCADCDS